MTELAIPEQSGTDLASAAPAQPGALMLWAQEARQASQIAASLARTSFVPASLRVRRPTKNAEEEEAARQEEVNNITAAILAGMELGLKPMATMRSIDIVQGTPALRAHTMRGLVQSKGHQVQLVEASPTRVVMRGRRAGEEAWQTVEWTIERAAVLGLTGREQYRKQPQTMLVARATGEICRLIAADALYAMPYAAEELEQAPALAAGSYRPVTAAEITQHVAEPTHATVAAPEHIGQHDESDYNAECIACEAEQAEADREAAP